MGRMNDMAMVEREGPTVLDSLTPAQVLGKNLGERRRMHTMSQMDLAEALDVHQNTVSNWETGKCLMSATTLARLTVVLRTSADVLLIGVA